MSSDISLNQLLEEQTKPASLLFVILPFNDEFVRIRLWQSRDECLCGRGFIKVPRSAIRSVTKTGKTAFCCGRSLFIVCIEFSEEPSLNYREVFSVVSSSSHKPRTQRKRPPRILKPLPVIPINPGGGGGDDDDGSYTGDPYEDSVKQQNCVNDCIQFNKDYYPPSRDENYAQWLTEVILNCEQACALYLTPSEDA